MDTCPPPVLSHVYYHGNYLLQAALRNMLFAVYYCPASQVAQWVKNLPATQEMQQTWVRSLGPEDALDKGMATHFSILAWRILMDRGAWRTAVSGVTKSQTRLNTHAHTHTYIYGFPWWISGKESTCQCGRHRFDPWAGKIFWRRQWQPTPVFLPGKSHGHRSLVGYSPWHHKRVGHDLATKQQQQKFPLE